jgi:hypothetical protein
MCGIMPLDHWPANTALSTTQQWHTEQQIEARYPETRKTTLAEFQHRRRVVNGTQQQNE